jgi:hypothetical protein
MQSARALTRRLGLSLFLFLLFLSSGRRAIALGFALLGFFMQLLEFLCLFGARLAVAFRTLLSVVRFECHGRSFSAIGDRDRNQEALLATSDF